MRTVRAFASESTECERFLTEIENNGLLHRKLGYGIGLFQVCTSISSYTFKLLFKNTIFIFRLVVMCS